MGCINSLRVYCRYKRKFIMSKLISFCDFICNMYRLHNCRYIHITGRNIRGTLQRLHSKLKLDIHLQSSCDNETILRLAGLCNISKEISSILCSESRVSSLCRQIPLPSSANLQPLQSNLTRTLQHTSHSTIRHNGIRVESFGSYVCNHPFSSPPALQLKLTDCDTTNPC